MIDRGALLVLRGTTAYRGTWRPALDAHPRAKEPALRAVVREYREALLDGEGVLEDLDLATDLLQRAHDAGITDVELIIFEVPQPTPAGALPLAVEPPAEGFSLAGWDVIELIEPFCSALRDAPESLRRNDFGLLTDRPSAESLARAHNATAPDDEVVAARIWRPDA